MSQSVTVTSSVGTRLVVLKQMASSPLSMVDRVMRTSCDPSRSMPSLLALA
jgi:hypothetical protein